ncbi:MAG TPA: tetratricopeptide repeat protein [Tepidisphaeraceae bacterium]|jgi:tetratricopeptide (TPR) repeat protein|nr:tetratricopeptide repeat protein [Tepidisphaeraceae bacterium]
MRNNPIVFPKFSLANGALLAGLALLPMLGGCLDGPSRRILNRGYGELKAQQYDSANADADEFLRAHPDGSGVAEAWYLKGRIAEARAQDDAAAPTDADKREFLDRAKDAYQQGLQAAGPADVRAKLHIGVANVDFYEEDYAGAVREFKSSYENIANEDTKAWVLYQIGRSEQRLGEFDQADKAFADVQRYYPGSDAATRAATRTGMNAFHVEVKKYGDVATAEKAAGKLRSEGLPASRTVDAGWQIVQIGPLPTYADAKAIQARIGKEYPGAIISP